MMNPVILHFYEEVIKLEHDQIGVYKILNSTMEIIYIGHGLIRKKLLSHLPAGTKPLHGARYYSVEYVSPEKNAEQTARKELEIHYEKHGRLPIYNENFGKK